MKYLTNLRSDQGVFPFRLADVDVVVVASTQTNRKFYNIKLSRYILYLVFLRRKGGKEEFVEEEFLRRKRSGGKKEENQPYFGKIEQFRFEFFYFLHFHIKENISKRNLALCRA